MTKVDRAHVADNDNDEDVRGLGEEVMEDEDEFRSESVDDSIDHETSRVNDDPQPDESCGNPGDLRQWLNLIMSLRESDPAFTDCKQKHG